MTESIRIAEVIRGCVNVADARLGARVLAVTDEFFAPKERMLNAAEPEWRAGVYDDHGKWMDGWETRRRRDSGYDHAVIQLAAPSTVALLDIDTRHFTGNYPPHASVQACRVAGVPDEHTAWVELLPHSPLRGNQRNLFEIGSPAVWTHLRLNIYPDGGVARLRAYGQVFRDWAREAGTDPIDLAAALHGGRAIACSDEHYGSMWNLILPGRAASMADGWETRRRREPGHDWVVLRLGHTGRIERVEVDTAFFKGNFPYEVSIHGGRLDADADSDVRSRCLYWPMLLAPQRLQADAVHRFAAELADIGPVSHVRVNMHPDGGMSRVRIYGRPHRD